MNRFRKCVTLLLSAWLIMVGVAAPLLDRGYSEGQDAHIEVPGGPAAKHAGQHNHAFCAVIASTHGLPGAAPAHAVACGEATRVVPVHSAEAPPAVRLTVLHSRAPPTL